MLWLRGLVGFEVGFISAFLMITGFIEGFSRFISGNVGFIIMFFGSIAAFVLFASLYFLISIVFEPNLRFEPFEPYFALLNSSA